MAMQPATISAARTQPAPQRRLPDFLRFRGSRIIRPSTTDTTDKSTTRISIYFSGSKSSRQTIRPVSSSATNVKIQISTRDTFNNTLEDFIGSSLSFFGNPPGYAAASIASPADSFPYTQVLYHNPTAKAIKICILDLADVQWYHNLILS